MRFRVWDEILKRFCFSGRDTRGFLVWVLLLITLMGIKLAFPALRLKNILSKCQSPPALFCSSSIALAASNNNTYLGSQQGSNYKNRSFESEKNKENINSYNKKGYNNYKNDTNSFNTGKIVYTSPYKKKAFEIEINSADTLDFQQLRGIGSAYAKRIVEYRNKLGGFVNKKQLREVWGIDSVLYSRIEPFLRLSPHILSPIYINEISIQELKQHPYIDYYQAKEIVRYREKYGVYSLVEDIKKVNLIDDETYIRIKPYVSLKGKPTDKKVN